jgi:Na+-translocating ferredoxin:NAD+ oxidoreductase RnfA subunit
MSTNHRRYTHPVVLGLTAGFGVGMLILVSVAITEGLNPRQWAIGLATVTVALIIGGLLTWKLTPKLTKFLRER